MEATLNLNLTNLRHAYVHRIGNKHNGGQIIFSEKEIPLHSTGLDKQLGTYFLKPFQVPEFQKFTYTNGDPELNAMHRFASAVFNNSDVLGEHSRYIAQHLFALSEHPQIKSGDLFVALFENVVYDNAPTQALGVFKAESKLPFLDIFEGEGGIEVHLVEGVQLDKLDKGCLIINTMADDGYRVLTVDRTNKSQEAAYWTEQFLRIEACADSFHRTKALLHDTRHFLSEALPEVAPVDKATQIDLLNKSVAYFKEKEHFDPDEFEETVFKEAGLVDAYRSFRGQRDDEEPSTAEASFELSGAAVKKYGKVYKSVLKLDKNFHIYIHGDRNLIERGRDDDGRKYYKIYYEEEQ